MFPNFSGKWRYASLLAFIITLSPVEWAQSLDDDNFQANLLFNTASRLYKQGSWSEAADAFDSFIKKFPRHKNTLEARFAKGYSLHRTDKHAEAIKELNQSTGDTSKPWIADAHFYAGRSAEKLAESKNLKNKKTQISLFKQAASSYEKSAKARSKNIEKLPSSASEAQKKKLLDLFILTVSSQGEAHYRSEEFQLAYRVLLPLAQRKNTLKNLSSYSRGLYFLALSKYQILQSIAPPSPTDRLEVIRLLEDYISVASTTEDTLPESLYLLGRLEIQSQAFKKARTRFDRLIQLNSARVEEARYYRGLSFRREGTATSLKLAKSELAKLFKNAKKTSLTVQAKVYEGLCDFDLKDYSQAKKNLATGLIEARELTIDPLLILQAKLRLGQSLILIDPPELDQSVKILTNLISTTSNKSDLHARARYWKAEALLAQKNSVLSAAQEFQNVFKLHRNQIPSLAEEALYKSALAYSQAGNAQMSQQANEQYLEAYGQSGRFKVEILRLSGQNSLGSSKEKEAAPGFYLKASALAASQKEKEEFIYLAGLAYYQLGKYLDAYRHLQSLVSARAYKPTDLSFYLADALTQEHLKANSTNLSDQVKAGLAKAIQHYTTFLSQRSPSRNTPEYEQHSKLQLTSKLHLGLCYQKLERPEDSQKWFKEWLKKSSQHQLAGRIQFELANACLKTNELSSAKSAYLASAKLSKEPNIAVRALLQVAMIERADSKPEKALPHIQAALTKAMRSVTDQQLLIEAHYEYASTLSELGSSQAKKTLKNFIDQYPTSAYTSELRLELASLELDDQNPSEVLQVLAPLISGNKRVEGGDEALYLSAWAQASLTEATKDPKRRKSAFLKMKGFYTMLLKNYPSSDFALDSRVELAERLFNEKELAEAKTLLDPFRTQNPKGLEENQIASSARAWYVIGLLDFEAKSYRSAAQLFDRTSSFSSEGFLPDASFRAARSWQLSGDMIQAQKSFESLVKSPDLLSSEQLEESYLRLGECLHKLRRYKDAEKTLKTMVKRFPKGDLLHDATCQLGFSLQFQDKTKEAVETYQKVVFKSRAPVAARAQFHIGECYLDSGDYKKAAREFLTVAANFDLEGKYRPWYRRALLSAGIAYEASGEKETAIKQWKELQSRFPKSTEAKAAARRIEEIQK